MISIEEFINVYRLTNFDGITINFVFEPRKGFVTCVTHSKVHFLFVYSIKLICCLTQTEF